MSGWIPLKPRPKDAPSMPEWHHQDDDLIKTQLSGPSDADPDGQATVRGRELQAGAGDQQTTQVLPGGYPATRHRPTDPATPTHPPTEVASPHPPTEVASPHPPTEVASPHPPTEVASPHPPTEIARSTEIASYGPAVPAPLPLGQDALAAQQVTRTARPAEIVRHGPGVPVSAAPSQAGLTAEQVWRAGRLPEPPRRPARLRRLAGAALTVLLLAASGAVFFSRLHHAPFHVTGVAIAEQTRTGCGVDVTARITTNGSAGTISYQWLFGSQQAPQPLSQSVVAGQHAVYVSVTVNGQGQGSVSQPVTLQLLGPAPKTATARVALSCQ